MKKKLFDQYGREINYVRLSVTDRCDLRCRYCMPKGFKGFSEPKEWLTFEEMTRVVRNFSDMGVAHVRVTGGEPLVRKNVDDLVRRLAHLPGVEDLSMSTNAVRLAQMAEKLKDAGLHRLNVSLDSIRADRYREITGGKLHKVLDGLEEAKRLDLDPIKINCVLMKGVNDDEIHDILAYCTERDFTLRLIETMPIGDSGRSAQENYMSLEKVREALSRDFDLIPDLIPGGGPARYYRLSGRSTRIGFITPISQHFCASCNRLRISCNGDIYTCLGDETRYPLGRYLRAGCNDESLKQHIRKAIDLKPKQHKFRTNRQQVVRLMSLTGG